MKRFLFTIILTGLLVVFLEPVENLLSKFLRLEQPTTHEIQTGEWLSKIAQEYYGDASYWRELALVNRAPNGDLIFPGEEIIVPSFESIQKIRKSRSLSAVNKLVSEQNNLLAGNIPSQRGAILSNGSGKSNSEAHELTIPLDDQVTVLEQGEQATEMASNSSFITKALMAAVLVLGLALIAGIYFFVRKKKREELSYYGAPAENKGESEPEMRRNIFLDDFAEEHHKDDSNSKRKEVKVV